MLRSAADVPVALLDEVIEDMARRMNGTEEARRCDGLSFTFVVADRRLAPAHYAVGTRGHVTVVRSALPATFTITGDSHVYDAVLRGHRSAVMAIVRGHVHLHGSLSHILSLLRMMPAVERAYRDAREALIRRHADRYEFAF